MTGEYKHICATTLDAKMPVTTLGEVVDWPIESCAFCQAGICVQSLAEMVVLHQRHPSTPTHEEMADKARKHCGCRQCDNPEKHPCSRALWAAMRALKILQEVNG